MPPESCLARLPVPVELVEGRARGCVHRHGYVGRRLVNTMSQSPKSSSDKTVSAAFFLCTNRHGCVPSRHNTSTFFQVVKPFDRRRGR